MFSRKFSVIRHETNCKITHKEETEKIEEMKLELLLKKEEIIRLKEEKEILKLEIKLQKSDKVDNITLKKLNKILLQRNNRIKNITNNTQNNIQINNYNLIGLGAVCIKKALAFSIHDHNYLEKSFSFFLNNKENINETLTLIVHCGKYDQFKNIIITNIKDNYIYKFKEKKGQFILSTKNDVLHSLVDYRMNDLEIMYNDIIK